MFGERALQLAAHCAHGRRLIIGDLGIQRITAALEDVSVKARFAGFEAGQQLEIEPLDQRVLQQDLLLAPQILDIERWLGAAGEARAEIFRIEVVGSGDLEMADPAYDNPEIINAV